MKKLIKQFGIFFIIAGLTLIGCQTDDPPASENGSLDIYALNNLFPEDGYVFVTDGPLFVRVVNNRNSPTGDLTLSVDGEDSGSFTIYIEPDDAVNEHTLKSIAAGNEAIFDIWPVSAEVELGHSAEITITGTGISRTLTVYYLEKPVHTVPINFTSLNGKWQVGAGNNGVEINTDNMTFRYFNSADTNNVNVTSSIDDYEEIVWVPGNSQNANAIVNNTAYRTIKLSCTITNVNDNYSGGDFINALFNIVPRPVPANTGKVNIGMEFDAWIISLQWEEQVITQIFLGLSSYNQTDGTNPATRQNHVPFAAFALTN